MITMERVNVPTAQTTDVQEERTRESLPSDSTSATKGISVIPDTLEVGAVQGDPIPLPESFVANLPGPLPEPLAEGATLPDPIPEPRSEASDLPGPMPEPTSRDGVVFTPIQLPDVLQTAETTQARSDVEDIQLNAARENAHKRRRRF